MTFPYLPNSTFVGASSSSPTLDVLATTHSGLGTNRPAYWTEPTGLIEIPLPDASPGADRGFVLDMSTNGIAACRVWIEGVPDSSAGITRAALYSPSTGRVDIEMPDEFTSASPMTISRDGSVLAGFAGMAGDLGYPWRWSEPSGYEIDTAFPQLRDSDGSLEHPYLYAWSNTPDGRYWALQLTYIDPDVNPPFGVGWDRTGIWEWGVGIRVLPVPPEMDANLDQSIMYRPQISEDGRRILAIGGDNVNWDRTERWIYDDPFDPDALPILATEFFESRGIDLSGWENFRTQRMSRDGTTFAGNGIFENDRVLWMIYIPPECPADVDHDGELTPADFQAWVDAYFENRIVADQNLDVYITPSDFNAWILNYNAGCP